MEIYSKLLFDYITTLEKRASLPFHIILEEAHRYVQNDTDTKILGYNIFDRITKEIWNIIRFNLTKTWRNIRNIHITM